MFCKQCGTQISPNMPACLKCGTKNIQTTPLDPNATNATQSAQISKIGKKVALKALLLPL